VDKVAIDNEIDDLLRRAQDGDVAARAEIRARYFDEARRICLHFAKRKDRNGASPAQGSAATATRVRKTQSFPAVSYSEQ
jgi:hypothetical protein